MNQWSKINVIDGTKRSGKEYSVFTVPEGKKEISVVTRVKLSAITKITFDKNV